MTTNLVGTCRVLFRFESENEGELDLTEHDIVEVLEEQADGWCVAEFKGTIGLVPATYLDKIPDALIEIAVEENGRPQKRAPAPPGEASAVSTENASNGEKKSPKSPNVKDSRDKDKDKKKRKLVTEKSRKKDEKSSNSSSPAPSSPRGASTLPSEPSSPRTPHDTKVKAPDSPVVEKISPPTPIEPQARPLPVIPKRGISYGMPKLPPKPTATQKRSYYPDLHFSKRIALQRVKALLLVFIAIMLFCMVLHKSLLCELTSCVLTFQLAKPYLLPFRPKPSDHLHRSFHLEMVVPCRLRLRAVIWQF
jgi:hypothetical protein